jgi:hypothetical protein
MDEVYAQGQANACGVAWPRETYLADVDPAFYVVNYLRAWALEASLRTMLRERYGSRWFAQAKAGSLLRELWHEGQRLDGDELARELGLPDIDLGVVVEDAYAALA